MQQRLQKILSQAGVTSRRGAEAMMLAGRVRVNGDVITTLGSRADTNTDHISVDGRPVLTHQPQTPVYLMFHKPRGVVSSLNDEQGRVDLQSCLQRSPFAGKRLFPVGRLDYHSEGLLLLTNDGAFCNRLLHPKFHVGKTYLVRVQGLVGDAAIAALRQGVRMLDEEGQMVGRSQPADVIRRRDTAKNSWLEITIYEGRKHQIKRMLRGIHHHCLRLIRIGFAGLTLGSLPVGAFRHVSAAELQAIGSLPGQAD